MINPYVLLFESELHLRCVPEFKFDTKRKWRFDYALPDVKVAIEIEGGVWTHGRHTRGKGYIGDMDKYNSATILGWRILRYQPSILKDTPMQIVKDIQALIINKVNKDG